MLNVSRFSRSETDNVVRNNKLSKRCYHFGYYYGFCTAPYNSRSPQDGASGYTTVDSGGAFRGCFQCWCSAARYCIVYNNIYSDVYSRCCARCSLTQHVSVNASTYTHIQVAHARARVLRECYVLYLAAELFVKAGACALENRCIWRAKGQDYDDGQHHATHVRVRSRVAPRESAGVRVCVRGGCEK